MISELERVMLSVDRAEYGLRRGDSGTIVLVHSDGDSYEVEFAAPGRETIVVSILASQVREMATDFWQATTIQALAELQGVRPVEDFDALLGGWPEDEAIDDFVNSVREWRRQNLVDPGAI
jgi:hypothetical protein